MTTEARKISFIQDFLKVDNEKILIAVEDFFYKTKSEMFEDNLKPMSIQQLEAEIHQAHEDEKNGKLVEASQLLARIK